MDSPAKKRKGLIGRVKGINRLFALTVLVPTTIAIVYYGLIASDVYVSESRFVVRSAQRQSQSSVVGALLQGSGLSRAQDDTYPVIDYIRSRDALRKLNDKDYILQAYTSRGDFGSRFHQSFDDSFEALWKYYDGHIVTVDFDSSTSITTLKVRAFTARDAAHIDELLLQYGEQLINQMNTRAAQDAITLSQQQVELAAKKAKDAAAALASYRNSETIFDPDKQSALQLQQIAGLQKNMMDAKTQLAQLLAIAPANPQVPTLRTQIETLQMQIATMTNAVAGSHGSLSDKAASYVRMQLDAEFANRELASAMTSLENARAEAQRQQLYLERVIQPSEPDSAIEPKRLQSIAATFLLGIVAWGILTIFIAGVKEHKD